MICEESRDVLGNHEVNGCSFLLIVQSAVWSYSVSDHYMVTVFGLGIQYEVNFGICVVFFLLSNSMVMLLSHGMVVKCIYYIYYFLGVGLMYVDRLQILVQQ